MEPSQENSDSPKKVYVSGYPGYTQRQDLKKVFSKYGNVNVDKITRQFAVLNFKSESEAREALSHSGSVIMYGEFLKVEPFTGQKKDSPKREVAKSEPRGKSIIDPKHLDFPGDFYDQLDTVLIAVRLTQQEVAVLGKLYADLESVLQQAWPGCVAVPFGSITTGLGVKSSDADCFIRVPDQYRSPNPNFVNQTKRLLQQHPKIFEDVIAIPRANTPIVKFFHVPTQTNCDVTFKTLLGVQNSKLIAFLLHTDRRLIPLAVMIKYWAKVHLLSGSGKLTNYALTILIIFYLQQAPISILPSVFWLQQDPADEIIVDFWNTGFMRHHDRLPKSNNTSSISELLGGFFEYYAGFNFKEMIVSPLLGYPIKKEVFKDFKNLPEEFWRYKRNVEDHLVPPLRVLGSMCIQDPFELCHNVASAISNKQSSDIQAYFKFAAAVYDKEKLNSCKGFLKKILLEKPKLSDANSPVYQGHVFTHLLYKTIESDWQGVIRGIFMKIFEEMCSIKLTKLEENLTGHGRKCKEEYTGDVTKVIWKRKQFSKLYSAMNMTFVKKQQCITNEIMKVEKDSFKMTFNITIIYFSDPRGALLILKLKEGDLTIYKEFGKFFLGLINGWFFTMLKPVTHQTETRGPQVRPPDNHNNENSSEAQDNVD